MIRISYIFFKQLYIKLNSITEKKGTTSTKSNEKFGVLF